MVFRQLIGSATQLMVFFSVFVFNIQGQEHTRDSILSPQKYRQQQRIAFSQVFMMNADISDITSMDQNFPKRIEYIMVGNAYHPYHIFPRRWPVHFVMAPIMRVRIIGNERSLPVRTPSYIPGGYFFFNINPKKNLEKYDYLSIGLPSKRC